MKKEIQKLNLQEATDRERHDILSMMTCFNNLAEEPDIVKGIDSVRRFIDEVERIECCNEESGGDNRFTSMLLIDMESSKIYAVADYGWYFPIEQDFLFRSRFLPVLYVPVNPRQEISEYRKNYERIIEESRELSAKTLVPILSLTDEKAIAYCLEDRCHYYIFHYKTYRDNFSVMKLDCAADILYATHAYIFSSFIYGEEDVNRADTGFLMDLFSMDDAVVRTKPGDGYRVVPHTEIFGSMLPLYGAYYDGMKVGSDLAKEVKEDIVEYLSNADPDVFDMPYIKETGLSDTGSLVCFYRECVSLYNEVRISCQRLPEPAQNRFFRYQLDLERFENKVQDEDILSLALGLNELYLDTSFLKKAMMDLEKTAYDRRI